MRRIDRWTRRTVARQEFSDAREQSLGPERRGERRQHHYSELLAQLMQRLQDRRVARTQQQDLADEARRGRRLQRLAGRDAARRHSKHDEIRQVSVDRLCHIARLRSFASDEAELFESFAEKCSNVLLAVGDADTRRNFAPAERRKLSRFLDARVLHVALHDFAWGAPVTVS
jgi:hypothetical protein